MTARCAARHATAAAMLTAALTAGHAPDASAQEPTSGWRRAGPPTAAPVTVFHSPQSANLPTAETLGRGEWLFEISHRFRPSLSAGADALWGFDGPVYNRLGLSYAPSDRLLLGIVRSNLDDNLEFGSKLRVAEGGRGSMPWMVAVAGGVAWNTDAPPGADDNEMQAYAQVVFNVLVGGRFAVGVVPSVLYNPAIGFAAKRTDAALGLNAQFYASDQMSLLGEWVVSPEHPAPDAARLEHDSATFGIELETGGHFFKVVLTNQVRMNPTQYLAGSEVPVAADEWRVGFNVTRLFHF